MSTVADTKTKKKDDGRLVRVSPDTHLALRLLAARLDLNLGEAVGKAVSHLASAIEQKEEASAS